MHEYIGTAVELSVEEVGLEVALCICAEKSCTYSWGQASVWKKMTDVDICVHWQGKGGYMSCWNRHESEVWQTNAACLSFTLFLLFPLKGCKRHLPGNIFLNSHTRLGPSLFKMPGSCCDASAPWALIQLGEIVLSCFLWWWAPVSSATCTWKACVPALGQEKLLLSQNTKDVNKWRRFWGVKGWSAGKHEAHIQDSTGRMVSRQRGIQGRGESDFSSKKQKLS